MKSAALLVSFLLLSASIATAQDVPGSGTSTSSQDQSHNATMSSRNSTAQISTIRGCLSGSADNYTLTDHSGTQYKLLGQNDALAAAVGHDVEIRGIQNQSAETASGEDTTEYRFHNTFQVSQVQNTGNRCSFHVPSKMTEHPMHEQPPKGAAESAPPPGPLRVAMLQEQQAPGSPDTSSPAAQNQQ